MTMNNLDGQLDVLYKSPVADPDNMFLQSHVFKGAQSRFQFNLKIHVPKIDKHQRDNNNNDPKRNKDG